MSDINDDDISTKPTEAGDDRDAGGHGSADTGDELGLIRVHREEWRAESGDDTVIKAGSKVRVVEVRGTRAVVFPIHEIDENPSDSPTKEREQ